MKSLLLSLLLFPTLVLADGDGSISGNVGTDQIVISTAAKYAGAIYSLTFRGKEYIDDTGGGHGRLMQSAFFGLSGACWNPTEAGARDDYLTPNYTTSILLNYSASGNYLSTQVSPAFWYHVGQSDQNCPGGATNGKDVSNQVFSKQVTIGRYGVENLIEYNIQMALPNTGGFGVFEALTGYMPQEFSVFNTIDLTTGALSPLSDGPGEQNLPIVFSTTDSQHAMGAYCQGLPLADYPNTGYGRWRFSYAVPPVVKWNAVYRYNTSLKGATSFRCYVAVGTTTEVSSALVAANLKAVH